MIEKRLHSARSTRRLAPVRPPAAAVLSLAALLLLPAGGTLHAQQGAPYGTAPSGQYAQPGQASQPGQGAGAVSGPQRATVQGKILNELSPNAYVLDNNVLVWVQRPPGDFSDGKLPEGTAIQATGVLQPANQLDLSPLLGSAGVMINGRTGLPWTGNLVLVAPKANIMRLPTGTASATGSNGITINGPVDGATNGSNGGAAAPGAASRLMPSDVTDNPTQYYRRAVVTQGRVGTVIGPHAFMLVDDAGRSTGMPLLVVSVPPLWQVTSPMVPLVPDRKVIVSGVLYQFNLLEFEQTLRLGLDRSLVSWNGNPALLLTGLAPTPATSDQGGSGSGAGGAAS